MPEKVLRSAQRLPELPGQRAVALLVLHESVLNAAFLRGALPTASPGVSTTVPHPKRLRSAIFPALSGPRSEGVDRLMRFEKPPERRRWPAAL